MKKQQSNNDQDYENMHHIARKRKSEAKRIDIRTSRDKEQFVSDVDEDELDYDPKEYARYIR